MSEELSTKVQDLQIDDSKAQLAKEEEASNKEPVIVLSTKELTHYHPLNGKWTLWYTKPSVDNSESWADLLKSVVTFSTVEEFWGVYNAVPAARELPIRSDYHLFREGIRPEWEDTQNAKGGKWAYQFKEKKKTDINDLWLRALLSAIGETIEEDEDEVNGIVLNVRKAFYRVGLWSKSCDKESLEPVGKKFKKVLKLTDNDKLEFTPHEGNTKSTKPLIIV